ncbi:MAG: glycosyltransferase family 2 protein [Eubacteriales bacterium]
MRFTVFTPTYNRGYIIDKLYDSLKKQTYCDFEWIVVDDGSTDDTAEKFKQFQAEDQSFPIIYQRVENGGKHRAINLGLKIASGELFFIVDSDDYLIDTALEIINRVEKSIPESDRKNFGGVCGQKGYSETREVGKTFDGEYLDITMLQRPQYNICGDKSEVFYTELLRKYPFPEFPGENFLTECVVWDKIAHDGFKLRFFNEIVYICDYLPDGLSANSQQLFQNSPKGYGLYLYQSAEYNKIAGVDKWNQYLKYYYQFRGKIAFKDIANNLHINTVVLYIRLLGMRLIYKILQVLYR